MSLYQVFDHLEFDSVPMEMAIFASEKRTLTIELDTASEKRATLTFSGVAGFQCNPGALVDRREFVIDGNFLRSVIEVGNSSWIELLNISEERLMEPVSQDLRHFVIPSSDGVWQILARQISLKI